MSPDELQRVIESLASPESTAPDGLPFGNRREPLDELVYILLTLMTRSLRAIEGCFSEVHQLTGGRFDRFDQVAEDELVAALRPVGLATRRSAQLRGISRAVRPQERWTEMLRSARDDDALAALQALPGVGAKTAKCVLMYSLDRAVLPVDIHVLRVAKRLQLVEPDATWQRTDRELEELVPDALKFDFHVRLVEHGRTICRSRNPLCDDCPIAAGCPSRGTSGLPRRAYAL